MIANSWELNDWMQIIFFQEIKQIWNNISVVYLKTYTKKAKTSKFYIEITYFFQLSFFSNLDVTSKSIHNRVISFGIFDVIKSPLTLSRMGGGQKGPPTSFSPVTSTNVKKLTPKTFWLLDLTLLTDWCKISSSYLIPVPNYWPWTKTIPQKRRFFWSNPYKIVVMITSLVKTLE